MTPITTWSNEGRRPVAEAIASRPCPQRCWCRNRRSAEIAGIIGRSTLVIGADTGLAHLASAFGLPTVAVFLATEPGLTGPRRRLCRDGRGRCRRASCAVARGEKLLSLEAAAAVVGARQA